MGEGSMKPVLIRVYFGKDEGVRVFNTPIVMLKSSMKIEHWEELIKTVEEHDYKRHMIDEMLKDYQKLLKEKYLGSDEL